MPENENYTCAVCHRDEAEAPGYLHKVLTERTWVSYDPDGPYRLSKGAWRCKHEFMYLCNGCVQERIRSYRTPLVVVFGFWGFLFGLGVLILWLIGFSWSIGTIQWVVLVVLVVSVVQWSLEYLAAARNPSEDEIFQRGEVIAVQALAPSYLQDSVQQNRRDCDDE